MRGIKKAYAKFQKKKYSVGIFFRNPIRVLSLQHADTTCREFLGVFWYAEPRRLKKRGITPQFIAAVRYLST
jgi:hypothetical protein